MMEKYREGQESLHCVFIDIEKADDRVPSEEVWNCLRLKELNEKYIRMIQDMYGELKDKGKVYSRRHRWLPCESWPPSRVRSLPISVRYHHRLHDRKYPKGSPMGHVICR